MGDGDSGRVVPSSEACRCRARRHVPATLRGFGSGCQGLAHIRRKINLTKHSALTSVAIFSLQIFCARLAQNFNRSVGFHPGLAAESVLKSERNSIDLEPR